MKNESNNPKKKTAFQPVGPRVLVRPEELPETSKGGIILLEESRKPRHGVVVGVGFRSDGAKLFVKAGDMVLFDANARVTSIHLDEVQHLLMNEVDVLGVHTTD